MADEEKKDQDQPADAPEEAAETSDEPEGESAAEQSEAVSEATDFGELTKDEKNMAMLAHLLGAFFNVLGPLIIWMIKKDESKFVDDQGKEALNFQLTLFIGYVISGGLAFFCIGAVTGPIIWLLQIIFGIVGGLKASKGETYRYPFALRLIK